MKKLLIVGLLLFFLPQALAQDTTPPQLSNPNPPNGTYIPGGVRTFSVDVIEENLNASNVSLYIKSADERVYDRLRLSCSNSTLIDWVCQIDISLRIVGDDTREDYYFEATDLSGNLGTLGSANDPLSVVVDINPPKITSVNIANNSYVSMNKKIKVSVYDVSSGVNTSSVVSLMDWLYGNATWNSTWQPMIYEDPYFVADWNNSDLPNDSIWAIYINASDNVGNSNITHLLDVRIDNEYPSLTVLSPAEGAVLFGTVELKVNTSDQYSGINSVTIEFVTKTTMSCTGTQKEYICSYSVDTTKIPDGTYNITFTSIDNAENPTIKTISVNVSNQIPSISITNPSDNAYLSGNVTVNVVINNPREIESIKLKYESESLSGSWTSMDCNENYTSCLTTLDTTILKDGSYVLKVNITNNLGYVAQDSVTVTVDNTEPELTIESPTKTEVNGTISVGFTVVDTYGVNPEKLKVEISGYTVDISCAKHVKGKKYVCTGNFDTTKLENGAHILYFEAEDLAGNKISDSKILTINNLEKASGETAAKEQPEIKEEKVSEKPEPGPMEKIAEVIKKVVQPLYSSVKRFFKSIVSNPVALAACIVLIGLVIYLLVKYKIFQKEVERKWYEYPELP
jgi:hypothetical protein